MPVCAHMYCLCARCRCSAHMCGACVCVCVYVCGNGSWTGGLGPEVGRQVQVGAPRGFSALRRLCPTSAWILCLDSVLGPVGVNPCTKSLDREPRRCQAPSPWLCGETGPEHAPPLTDHQDGLTRCPGQTLQDSPAWATVAAPPAGSLGCCSRATSGLSLLNTGLSSRKFVALPWSLTTMCPQKLVTVLFYPMKCLVTKLLFHFLMWVKCETSDDFFKKDPNSHTEVSPLSNDERPQVCDLCLLGVQP